MVNDAIQIKEYLKNPSIYDVTIITTDFHLECV